VSLPLDVALKQCTRHAEIMLAALGEMPAPLSADQLQHASPELIRLMDQFVLRFTKLQDTLGAHVLRQFAARILIEPVEDVPFIDVLDLLERRGYLTTEAWALQRSTRNALTHEYPEDPQRQALALNAARQAAQQLNQWLEKISLQAT
jgi:benzoyl-CoA reductase/2-hydroxyglutaryl-CoA dehydratase subunit BcrC/BadD/HgdB